MKNGGKENLRILQGKDLDAPLGLYSMWVEERREIIIAFKYWFLVV